MMIGAGWAMGLGGGLWMLVELVAVIAVIAAIVWILAGTSSRSTTTTGDAARILNERLARGEISEAEYVQARSLLGLR